MFTHKSTNLRSVKSLRFYFLKIFVFDKNTAKFSHKMPYTLTVEIYIEDVLIVNFVADFSMLFCATRLCGIKSKPRRLILSALLGASFALVFLPKLFDGFLLIAKFLEGVLLLIVCGVKKEKFLPCLITLFLVSFAMLGIIYGISLLFSEAVFPKAVDAYRIFDNNPVLMSAFSSLSVLSLTVFCAGKVRRRKLLQKWLVKMVVSFSERKTATLSAFIDSGNLILDEKTGLTVPVFSYFAIANHLEFPSFEKLSDFPIRSAGGFSKLKKIIVPRLVIKYEDKEYIYTEILCCVSLTGFSEEFDALISPELIK